MPGLVLEALRSQEAVLEDDKPRNGRDQKIIPCGASCVLRCWDAVCLAGTGKVTVCLFSWFNFSVRSASQSFSPGLSSQAGSALAHA